MATGPGFAVTSGAPGPQHAADDHFSFDRFLVDDEVADEVADEDDEAGDSEETYEADEAGDEEAIAEVEGDAKEIEELKKKGYQRLKVDGNIYDIDDVPSLKKNFKHNIDLALDLCRS